MLGNLLTKSGKQNLVKILKQDSGKHPPHCRRHSLNVFI